jgi:hypothetical protein
VRRNKPRAKPRTRHGDVPDPAEFGERLRKHLAAELDKPCPNPTDGSATTNFEALSEKLVQMAVAGSKDAIHIVLDRLAGRTPQAASAGESEPQHIEYVIEIPRPEHEPQGTSSPAGSLQTLSPAG